MLTVTSQNEWDFVERSLLSEPHGNFWMGGKENSSQWGWVTGEVWNFTKWWWSEPNGNPNDVLLVPFTSLGAGNNWYDHDSAPAPNDAFYPSGYIFENGYPTDPFQKDTDGDGFEDGQETAAQTDPNDPAATPGFEDTVPPTIASLGVQPATVDVSSGPVTAKFSARFKDAISGVSWWSATFVCK